MKRRSFLALLGLAPVAMALPRAAVAAEAPVLRWSDWHTGYSGVFDDINWSHDSVASVWVHVDGRFVTDQTLAEAGEPHPRRYCHQHNIRVVGRAGDYIVLSNGSAMHSRFRERITWRS